MKMVMNNDFFKMSALEQKIDNHQKMSFGMKGIAALVIFTACICARPNDVLVLYISIPVTLIVFFLNVYFLKEKKNCEMALQDIINKDMDTPPKEVDPAIRLPILYYIAMLIIIVIGLVQCNS